MLDDEQVYPIETAAEVEDVSGLSAFQVRYLVLAANPEAMYSAAKDYLCTAERLEATADGIRRGATDLADSWHGGAADASQRQMQQYYASARSLATACRASAAALNHAAAALTATQIQILFFPGGDFPSPDPTSLQSLCYQKALADLNAAYRDAATLAPTQIAVTLPGSGDLQVREVAAEWEDTTSEWEDAASSSMYAGMGQGLVVNDQEKSSLGPTKLPSEFPSNPPNGGSTNPSIGAHASPPIGGPAECLGVAEVGEAATSDMPGERNSAEDAQVAGWAGKPYEPQTSLAGPGIAGGVGTNYPSSIVNSVGSSEAVVAGPVRGGSEPTSRMGAAARGADVFGQAGGIVPAAQGQQNDELTRERRYFLKEEREVWGLGEVTPPVLYGEHRPPVRDEDDDDYDDF